MVPLFRGSSRFESLVLSHHLRFTCECNKEEINDDDEMMVGDGRKGGAARAAGERGVTPTPLTLYPKVYTLHPQPLTLHPIPYTLNPTP